MRFNSLQQTASSSPKRRQATACLRKLNHAYRTRIANLPSTVSTPAAPQRHPTHCSAQSPQPSGEPSAPSDPKYAYSDPVNQLLGNFLPAARDAAAELSHIDWDAPKAAGLPLSELAARFTTEFLTREWFVTGDVPPELFSDGFAFKDESVATNGIKSYALGVRKLFDQATARAELVSVNVDHGANAIVVTW